MIDIEWLYIVSQESLLSIMDENINLQQNDDNLLHSFFISLFNPESMVQGLDTHTNKLSIFQIERCSQKHTCLYLEGKFSK